MQNVQFYACPMTAPPSSQKQGHYHCKNQSYKTEASRKNPLKRFWPLENRKRKKNQESDSMPQIGTLR